jgi:hypothetical protein
MNHLPRVFGAARARVRAPLSRFVLIAPLLAWFVGCSSSASPLEEARSQWVAVKPTCGTYSYRRVFQSVFGWGWQTAVEITGDAPTRRHFSTTGRITPAEWDERGAEVGAHADVSASPAETMEKLLSECATVLAADQSQNVLTSEFDANGVPRVCTSTIKGASDDASSGIWIDQFACAPLDANGAVVLSGAGVHGL